MEEIRQQNTLLDEYQNIIVHYKKSLEEKQELLNKEQEEIEAIKEKYRFPLIDAEKNIKSNLEAVQEFNNLLTNYSTFDEHMITDAICLLIHIVEEQNFQYQKANYYIEYLFYGIWGGSEERFNLWKAKIIVNAEKRRDEYYHLLDEEDEVKKLVEGGDAILLQKVGYSIPKKDGKIIFYFLNDHHNMTCSSDFGRFDYVKNFIDFVILYRFSHNLTEISKEDIKFLITTFIQNNKALLVSNFASRVQARILKL